MKRFLFCMIFIALSFNVFASDHKQNAYNKCLAMKKGSFSEKASQAICNCYAQKVMSFTRGLAAEGLGRDDDETSTAENDQVSEKYSNEFFRVCLFSAAPRDELEANGIRIVGK